MTRIDTATLEHEVTTSSLTANISLLLSIVSVILTGLCLYFVMGYTINLSSKPLNTTGSALGGDAVGLRKALLEHEYEKVGGKENYEIMQKIQLSQIQENIPKMREYLNNGSIQGSTQDTHDNPQGANTLTADQMKNILQNAYIEGNKLAPVALIEYSEMECPYCAQQYHDTKIREIVKQQYPDTVSFVWKNNRGANHPGTEAKALGLLCAGEIGGQSAYTKFYTYVMDRTTLRPQKRDGTVFEVSKLSESAKASGVDEVAWKKCVEEKKTLARFTAETQEAQSVGLDGTPGTLILDTKTGKYYTVKGAYPAQEFQKYIDMILKS